MRELQQRDIVTRAGVRHTPAELGITWDEIEALRASSKGRARKGFMGKAWDAGVPGVAALGGASGAASENGQWMS